MDETELPTSADELPEWYLATMKADAESGDNHAYLFALKLCLEMDTKPPRWVADHVADGLDRFLVAEEKELGAALGVEREDYFYRASAEKRAKIAAPVAYRIAVLHFMDGEALDDGLFERVGKEFNIGKTLAKEYYYGSGAGKPKS